MKFEKALAAMREGKKVKRSKWLEREPIELKMGKFYESNEVAVLNTINILADDWEIYEEPKWEPKLGEWCAEPAGVCHIAEVGYHGHSDFGDTRPTKEQAEKARDRMRAFNRLLAYVDEHAPGWESDMAASWGGNEPKRYVYFNHRKGKWDWNGHESYQIGGCVYMPKEVAIKLVDDLNSGRVEL